MVRPKILYLALIVASLVAWIGNAPAQTPPAPQAAPAAAPAAPQATDTSIGSVATLAGSASVTRNNAALTLTLKLSDPVYKGDLLQTTANGTLGITFDDDTTFTLKPNSRMTVDEFIYQEGGSSNAAVFNVVRGTVAFVASEVAKTGDMKINTPTATLGIRGTSGLVEIPEGPAVTGAGQVAIKLYPDADGRVGRIEVFGRDGGQQLGILTRGATGFSVRPGAAGATRRFVAVPLQISAAEAERDRSFVRQAVTTQLRGRQLNIQRHNLRPGNQQRPRQQGPNQQRPNQPGPNQQRPNPQRRDQQGPHQLRTNERPQTAPAVRSGTPVPPGGHSTQPVPPGLHPAQPTGLQPARPTNVRPGRPALPGPTQRPALQRRPGLLPPGGRQRGPLQKKKDNH
jgi:hypothetical protein